MTAHAEKAETLMLALRKREGISLDAYQNRFGEEIETAFGNILKKWFDLQLLEQTSTHLASHLAVFSSQTKSSSN